MKKTYFLMVLVVLSLFVVRAVSAQEDIKQYPSCKYCGMDREKFAHSRVLIEYDDGTAVPLAASTAQQLILPSTSIRHPR